MSKVTTERRAHARHRRTFELHGNHAEGTARMVATNLSLGGLYCTSTTPFDEMTRLAVRLMLPRPGCRDDVAPLDVEAVVVRRRALDSSSGNSRYELALFFPQLDDEQRERLREYLGQ